MITINITEITETAQFLFAESIYLSVSEVSVVDVGRWRSTVKKRMKNAREQDKRIRKGFKKGQK